MRKSEAARSLLALLSSQELISAAKLINSLDAGEVQQEGREALAAFDDLRHSRREVERLREGRTLWMQERSNPAEISLDDDMDDLEFLAMCVAERDAETLWFGHLYRLQLWAGGK